MTFRRISILGLLLFALAIQASAGDVGKFLKRYCYDCHDSELQKGERDFESFRLPLKTPMDLFAAQEIIDQVTLKEMPPKKADQPTEEERLQVIRDLRQGVRDARSVLASSGGRTVMRRLSKREYEITLETLFGRRLDTLGLTEEFPKEKISRHMDNIGQSLVTSGFLLDQYFLAADRLVELRLNRVLVEPKTWHFQGNFKQYEELTGSHKAVFKNRYLCIYEQPNTDTRQGGYGHIEEFLQGVPVSGLYDLKVLARAMHRDTHYDPKILGMDFSEPFLLGIVPGDVRKGHIHYPQRVEPLLAKPVVLPDDEPEWQSFQVWLEKGQTPRFIFPNGAYESRASVLQLNKRYQEELGIKKTSVSRAALLRKGKLPHIRISEIKIHGPLAEPGGGLEEISIFGKYGFQAKRAVEQLLAFGQRACRRPLTKEDRNHITKIYKQGLAGDASPRQAALDTIKMILCSPFFLYLSEITMEKEIRLRPFDLASRLSYALWSAPPDEKLLKAAATGALVRDEILLEQVDRLLEDPRSTRFVEGFLDSWLGLRDLGSQPPSRNAARSYYAEDLPTSMKEEVRRFFTNLLRNNGPVTDFLDADYTFVDKKLAKLYNLPEKDTLRLADGFKKVSLKGNARRGGALGMAGVLAVSANGVDTSPVTRGVWIAENILGSPPPPPPDEVPAIDTDVRGAKTIRERLQRHSDSNTCAECHRRIDPFGFPLENFDPIGRWRDSYQSRKKGAPRLKVDPSGELPSGETFKGFSDFKKILAAHRSEPFTRHLISQVLTYASGRHMEALDQFEIDEILARVKQDKHGLRTLIRACLTSDIVRSR
ncbi:MAG: hypothetical protein ACI8QF_003597 [Limisphaerales bacterium]|jgi:hypothetical protein